MAKNDKVRVDGMTRQEWLTNNANIVLGEGGDDDEVFFNQIETRLRFVPEIQNEADERLADAYINSLARYEAEGESATWSPRSVESLVAREGVTAREAGVIVIIAAREYGKVNKVIVVYDRDNDAATALVDYSEESARAFMLKRSADEGWGQSPEDGIDGLEFIEAEVIQH